MLAKPNHGSKDGVAYHFFASARSVAATNLASDVDDTNVHSGKEDFEPRRGIWKERDAAVKAKPLLGPMDVMCD